MATVQIRRPKNVWGNNLTLNYDISVSVNNIQSLYLFIYLPKSCNLWVILHYRMSIPHKNVQCQQNICQMLNVLRQFNQLHSNNLYNITLLFCFWNILSNCAVFFDFALNFFGNKYQIKVTISIKMVFQKDNVMYCIHSLRQKYMKEKGNQTTVSVGIIWYQDFSYL